MKLFRTRSVVVQAIQVTGSNWSELAAFAGADRLRRIPRTLPRSGVVAEIWAADFGCWLGVRVGDWVERGARDALVPVRPEHANARYAAV